MDHPPGQQKNGGYREVAVSGSSTVLLFGKSHKLILGTLDFKSQNRCRTLFFVSIPKQNDVWRVWIFRQKKHYI